MIDKYNNIIGNIIFTIVEYHIIVEEYNKSEVRCYFICVEMCRQIK